MCRVLDGCPSGDERGKGVTKLRLVDLIEVELERIHGYTRPTTVGLWRASKGTLELLLYTLQPTTGPR